MTFSFVAADVEDFFQKCDPGNPLYILQLLMNDYHIIFSIELPVCSISYYLGGIFFLETINRSLF